MTVRAAIYIGDDCIDPDASWADVLHYLRGGLDFSIQLFEEGAPTPTCPECVGRDVFIQGAAR